MHRLLLPSSVVLVRALGVHRKAEMCGIIAVLLADASAHVNQMLCDGLTMLQHRGQGAVAESPARTRANA